ncbi:GH32 C-terminal domain-containing protein [Paenibacillus sp. Z6-24]
MPSRLFRFTAATLVLLLAGDMYAPANSMEAAGQAVSRPPVEENNMKEKDTDDNSADTTTGTPIVWNSNLTGERTHGTAVWAMDQRGIHGTADGTASGIRTYTLPGEQGDAVIMTDLMPAEEQTEAGLFFHGTADGQQGYIALLIRQDDRVRVRLQQVDGTVLATSAADYYSEDGVRHRLEIHTKGSHIRLFLDGYAEPALESDGVGRYGNAAGIAILQGAASFQDTYVIAAGEFYGEPHRPDYHYSALRGWASDPNGLIYYKGEYHLFHQDGGRWAHAVSDDLLHWKNLPFALEWNELGHIWSGSAIADEDNVSGFFDDSAEGGGLIAYYTSYTPDRPNGNQKIGIAYSMDRGRTWHYPEDRPVVIPNPGQTPDDPGSWDFRDPKIVRDEARNRWVMVVSGGDHVRLFTSTNLLDWKLTDNFGYGDYIRGGVWECPDLFQLPVEGTDESKWVLMISTGAHPDTGGSDAEYFIGQLSDEGRFMNDNPPGQVLKTDWGKEFYASMSFAGLPDKRRIVMAWMTNWDYAFDLPTVDWKGILSTPRELSLIDTAAGTRLAQTPARELDTLRTGLRSIRSAVVNESSANVLAGLVSGSYEIEAEVELPAHQPATEFGFRLRTNESGSQFTEVGYHVASGQLFLDRTASGITDFSDKFSTRHATDLQPNHRRVKLRILVDESTVEIFAADGQKVFSNVIFPDAGSKGMSFYVHGGQVKLLSMDVYQLSSVWK